MAFNPYLIRAFSSISDIICLLQCRWGKIKRVVTVFAISHSLRVKLWMNSIIFGNILFPVELQHLFIGLLGMAF